MEIYDVIIIGAGPAGLNTALYTARSNLKTLILEKGIYGGQLNNTELVENYIGADNITGIELAENMYNQATRFGVTYAYGEVEQIIKDNLFIIKTDVETFTTRAVVIATGTTHRKLGVEGEDNFNGRGVSYCAICDGAFFKDGNVFVIGGGDSALEEGEYLTNYGKKVSLVHRRNELRGTKILQDRFSNKENTEYILESNLIEIKGDENKVTSVRIKNNDGSEQEMDADGIFIYVGLDPNTEQFRDLGITDSEGYIDTNENMETKVSGIFAVGDVRQKKLRQIATAVGDGSICGTEVYNYITKLKD